VSIGEQELRQLLPPGLSIAAVNAPSLCVVSGPPALVEDFERSLERDGRPGRRLHVARAFHSEMVEPILAAFDRHLRGVRFNAPKTPFVSTVSGTWIKEREAADPSYWVRHLRQTVRFGDGVRTLLEDADRVLLEVGPGNTLASLARQQQAARDRLVVASLPHPQEARSDSAHLLTTLGRLWTCGVDIDWRAFHARETRSIVDLPTYPFERQRYWIDARKDARTSGAAASRGHLGAKASVDRWLYAPTWKRSIAPAGPRIEADRWLVFLDRGGLGGSKHSATPQSRCGAARSSRRTTHHRSRFGQEARKTTRHSSRR
jgi:acyl transferase domain-containing protein